MAKPSKPTPGVLKPSVMSFFDERLKERNSAEAVWNQVLAEMLVLYYPPFRADDDVELCDQAVVGLRAYVEDLAEFPADVLNKAWREVRRAHKVERWPTIQVIRDACIACQAPHQSHRQPAADASQQAREDNYRRTGFWLDSWGDRPVTEAEKARRNRDWWERFNATASPQMVADAEMLVQRVRDGESPSRILAEVLSNEANAMPVLPAERMGRGTAERRRQDSIRRAQEDAA